MKAYPSIPNVSGFIGNPCIAFYKYDGSNLRAEFNRKSGWHKFGTRTRLFDKSDPDFGSAIEIFNRVYAEDLENLFKKEKLLRNAQSIIVYMEFFGANSFAGQHKESDPKELILFDINVHKQGILSPNDFLDIFGHLKVAKVIYQGNLTQGFVNQVRNNEIDGLREGVICKGGFSHKLWMCKIKTLSYLEELKKKYADWEKYWE